MTKFSINYECAVEFETKIFNEMLQHASTPTQREYIVHLFKNDIFVIPHQDESQIITMNISSQYSDEYNGISCKLSNVQLNLKDSILTAIEFTLGVGLPETKIDLLKLALMAIIKLYVFSTVKLSNYECLLLLYLHEKDAYNVPISEEEIFDAISNGELRINRNEYSVAIKNLIRIASVIVRAGDISLKEKIVLQYN